MIVIGILAAIAIFSYNGIQQRAISDQYVRSADSWEKLIRSQRDYSAPLPSSRSVTQGSSTTIYPTCLGKSIDDFPAANGFMRGECFKQRNSDGTTVSITYDADYMSQLTSIQKDFLPGLLPVTTLTGSDGSVLTARGVVVVVFGGPPDQSVWMEWVPPAIGMCGRGVSLGSAANAPSGGQATSPDICLLITTLS